MLSQKSTKWAYATCIASFYTLNLPLLKEHDHESILSDNITRNWQGFDTTPEDRQGIAVVASRKRCRL